MSVLVLICGVLRGGAAVADAAVMVPQMGQAGAEAPGEALPVAIAPSRGATGPGEDMALPPEVQRLVADSIEVLYWPGHEWMAERTLRAATVPLRLPGLAVAAPPPAARILLAPDGAAYDSLTGGAPHWSAGVAIPARRTIVLPAYSSRRTPMGDPLVALRHELIHLALSARLPGRIPRWFNEGYATWASGDWDAGRGWEIRLALLGGGAPPLDSLRLGWPGGEADARLAYLLSASAVSHLASLGGEGSFAAFMAAWQREGDFDRALRGTYGLTLTHFEADWREMVKRRYGWMLALSQVGVMWALIAIFVVVMTLPRRRRNREKLHQMRVDDWMDEWRDEIEGEGEEEWAPVSDGRDG